MFAGTGAVPDQSNARAQTLARTAAWIIALVPRSGRRLPKGTMVLFNGTDTLGVFNSNRMTAGKKTRSASRCGLNLCWRLICTWSSAFPHAQTKPNPETGKQARFVLQRSLRARCSMSFRRGEPCSTALGAFDRFQDSEDEHGVAAA